MEPLFSVNNTIYSNNNIILNEIVKNLENIIKERNNRDDMLIIRLKTVIELMQKVISNNKNNANELKKYIDKINLEWKKKFDDLKNIINKKSNDGIQERSYGNGKYKGPIVNGKREGFGIFIWKCGDKYEGDFKDDHFTGKGIYYYNSGNRYEGNFKNIKKEGKGIFYYNDGDRYEGDWRNGNMEGQGIMYYSNGDRKMGNYINDKPIGIHAYLTADGKVFAKNYS